MNPVVPDNLNGQVLIDLITKCFYELPSTWHELGEEEDKKIQWRQPKIAAMDGFTRYFSPEAGLLKCFSHSTQLTWYFKPGGDGNMTEKERQVKLNLASSRAS